MGAGTRMSLRDPRAPLTAMLKDERVKDRQWLQRYQRTHLAWENGRGS